MSTVFRRRKLNKQVITDLLEQSKVKLSKSKPIPAEGPQTDGNDQQCPALPTGAPPSSHSACDRASPLAQERRDLLSREVERTVLRNQGHSGDSLHGGEGGVVVSVSLKREN